MITQDNYYEQINRIGISNLPEDMQETHKLIDQATSKGTNWSGLKTNMKEVIKLQLELLEDYATESQQVVVKPEKQRARKKKVERTTEKKLVKVKRKPVKVAPKKAAPVKKKEKRVTNRLKLVKPPKAPITVKKYSLELQHIKRFAHMHGKDHKLSTLQSFLKTIEKHIKADDYLNHRSMITEIATRLARGLETAKGSTLMAVTIEPTFREKVKDLIANAKVRMRTEFVAGINSENRSQKQD